MNLNKVFILGNVTRDPDKKSLPSGQSVVSLGVASNRFYQKDGQRTQDTEFHNVILFGKLADISAQYLKKGSLVLIEGRLKTRVWDDKNNQGIKHYRTEIIAESLQLGPRNASSVNSNNSNEGLRPIEPPKNDIPIIEEGSSMPTGPKTDEIDVKDIPF